MQLKKQACPLPYGQGPRLDPHPLNYRADGSGRDTYVVHNAGGLVADQLKFKPVGEAFKSTLRDHNRISNQHYNAPVKSSSDIETYLNWYAPYSKKHIKGKTMG